MKAKSKISFVISFVLNVLIVAMVVFATISMWIGFRFMGDDGLSLAATGASSLRFFTVDSNLLMGLVALVYLVFQILVMSGRIGRIPVAVTILKFVATVGVVLTFLVTACFLAPFLVSNYFVLFLNSNLFFHFLVPVVSAIAFLFCESTADIRWRYSFLGIVPMGIYAIGYTANAIAHAVDGKVDPQYDWYYFVQGGVHQAFFVLPIMLVATYLICYLLWLGNHQLGKRSGKHATQAQ